MSEPGNSAWPVKGRLLGVDYGTVRVGLAVTDPDRILASPLETYVRRNMALDAAYFQALVKAERVVGLIVGLAVHMSGDEGAKAKECRDYGGWLAETTGLPVVFWDERYTTALAEDALKEAGVPQRQRKGKRDRVAAQMILQAFLEAGGQDTFRAVEAIRFEKKDEAVE